MTKMLQKNKVVFLGLALSFTLFSCDKQRVFDEYQEIDGSWHKKQKSCPYLRTAGHGNEVQYVCEHPEQQRISV